MKLFFQVLTILLSLSAWATQDLPSINQGMSAELCEVPVTGEIDMSCIEQQLQGDGLGGWVHASVQDQLLFVFTWRRPQNFFVNLQLPMTSNDPVVLQQLQQLRRHDRIIIKGGFINNNAPIEHINVTDLQVIEPYQGINESFEYDPNLPQEILNGNRLIGKVHATGNGGSVLVIEVGDRVYPVFNSRPELVANLYRNDKIEIFYNVQIFPTRPPHLSLDVSVQAPITVLEEIVQGHGEAITLTGPLVMFPQSPQIIFNIYALRAEDSDGVKRNYTLVNFSDFDLFTEIREKLEAAWNNLSAEAKYDRNKYINYKIEVEAHGIKNVQSPLQANPQILLNSIDDINIQFL